MLLGLLVRDPESAGLAGLFPIIILTFTSSTNFPSADGIFTISLVCPSEGHCTAIEIDGGLTAIVVS